MSIVKIKRYLTVRGNSAFHMVNHDGNNIVSTATTAIFSASKFRKWDHDGQAFGFHCSKDLRDLEMDGIYITFSSNVELT